MIDEHLRYLLTEFIDHYRKEVLKKVHKVDAVKLSTRVEILKRINIVRDYMESYYTEDISLKYSRGGLPFRKYVA